MKLKIKVKEITEGCMPKIIGKGDWIDLYAACDVKLECLQADILKRHKDKSYREVNYKKEMIPLGVAMKLPKGFEAIVVPRSSSFKNWDIMQTNSVGVIDNSYSGNKDEWHMPVIMFGNGLITKGSRVCQFKIQLSQKANFFTKLKWLFSNGVKLVRVNSLDDKSRGGFGSTGID